MLTSSISFVNFKKKIKYTKVKKNLKLIAESINKEQKKFIAKFGNLTSDKMTKARKQKINQGILAADIFSKIFVILLCTPENFFNDFLITF